MREKVGRPVTFISHTSKPGGGELALRRYLESTSLPVRLVTLETGGVWKGLDCEVVHTTRPYHLRRALGRDAGEVVVANSMRAAFLAAIAMPPGPDLVYWVRDGLNDSAMSRLALALTRHVTARRVKAYLSNSVWTASTVRQALGARPENVHVVTSMSGVSWSSASAREPRTSFARPLRLLFLGRISPWKGPHVAVRALAQLRSMGVDATLTVAGGTHFGEQAYGAHLRDLVETASTATMLGHVDDIKPLLDSHDMLVHCSTVPEPFGQVIVQALGAGLPVVATRGGGPMEILAGAPVDVTYESGSATALAQAVHRAMQHYPALSAWSLMQALSYADEKVLAETDMVLSRLSSERREN